MLRWGKAWWWILAGLVLVLSLAQASSHQTHQPAQVTTNESSRSSARDEVVGDHILVAQLPPEGRETLQLIKRGGPFPYPRDGVVFGNYERLLPKQSRGYYHEYTVKTPGISHRGPRRIVCGEVHDCYYTVDHYKSFKRIMETR